MAFNRCLSAVWCLGLKQLRIIWSSFYDDYPTLAPTIVAPAVEKVVVLFLHLLGWDLTTDLTNSFDFAESFA